MTEKFNWVFSHFIIPKNPYSLVPNIRGGGGPTDNLNINKRGGGGSKEKVVGKMFSVEIGNPLSLIMGVPNNYL